MIEHYRQRLRVIEHILGANWLANRSERQKSAQKPGRHPAQKFWTLAQSTLDTTGTSLLYPGTFDLLADIEELAEILQIASKLQGFNDLMLPKLKEKECTSQYHNLLHEIRIAARHAKLGQQVSFVPTLATEGIKTPDIAINIAGTTIRIECKRRQRIQPLSISDKKKEHINSQIGMLLDSVKRNFDLFTFVVGEPDGALLQNAFTHLRKFVESGGIGRLSFLDAGVWFLVKDRPPPPAHRDKQIAGLPYDLQQNAPFSLHFTAEGDETRGIRFYDWRTSYLFNFSSHAFKQLTYSFDQGRKQFSPSEIGAICIDVDPVGMTRSPLDWYLALMGTTLADHAWRGGQNTRIGILTLMAGPLRTKVEREGCEVCANEYIYCDVLAAHLASGGRIEDSPVYKVFDQLPGRIVGPNPLWAEHRP